MSPTAIISSSSIRSGSSWATTPNASRSRMPSLYVRTGASANASSSANAKISSRRRASVAAGRRPSPPCGVLAPGEREVEQVTEVQHGRDALRAEHAARASAPDAGREPQQRRLARAVVPMSPTALPAPDLQGDVAAAPTSLLRATAARAGGGASPRAASVAAPARVLLPDAGRSADGVAHLRRSAKRGSMRRNTESRDGEHGAADGEGGDRPAAGRPPRAARAVEPMRVASGFSSSTHWYCSGTAEPVEDGRHVEESRRARGRDQFGTSAEDRRGRANQAHPAISSAWTGTAAGTAASPASGRRRRRASREHRHANRTSTRGTPTATIGTTLVGIRGWLARWRWVTTELDGVGDADREPAPRHQADEDEHGEVLDLESRRPRRGTRARRAGELAGERPRPAEQRQLVVRDQLAAGEVRDELREGEGGQRHDARRPERHRDGRRSGVLGWCGHRRHTGSSVGTAARDDEPASLRRRV